VDVFAVGPGGGVWRWAVAGAAPPSLLPLPPNGTIPAEGICAVPSGPGRIEVFAVEAGSRTPVWWRGDGAAWRTGPNPPRAPSIPAIPVAAVAASPRSIDVLAVGTDRLVWWWRWNGAAWSAPIPLPVSAPAARIAAVSAVPGRLDVFAAGINNHLMHCWRVGGLAWNVQDLGGDLPASGVSAVSWGPGRIDVFAASRLPGNPLLHWWGDNGVFSGPEDLGGSLAASGVSAVSHAADRLDVFGVTRDRRVGHWQWDGGRWFGPGLRGDDIPAGDVSAVARPGRRLDVFVRGAGNALLQWPGGGVENRRDRRWENWPTTFGKSPPPGVLRPDSLEELVTVVRQAERSGLGVRAVGTGWSSSDVAVSPGYVVETDLLGSVLTNVTTTSLNAEGAAMRLLHVEGGMKLDRLVATLRSLGWEMKTLGGSTGQSVAGAISTSVHGMDPTMGPLPDTVRAIHLVGPGGAEHWIEPAGRIITERAALRTALNIADENIHYDDEWFNSVLVSMGSLGIIYSVILEFDERYDLVETRERFDWNSFKPRLLANDATNPLRTGRDGVQVVISPYASADGTRNCYLTTRRRDIATAPLPAGTDWLWLIRDLTPAMFSTWRTDRSTVDETVIWLTDQQQGAKTSRGLAHGMSGPADPGGVRGIGLEMIFDAGTTAYLDFVEDALGIIRAAYYDSTPQPWSYLGWMSLRYQGRSVAYLSPQHEAALSCSVEFAAAYRRPELPGIGWADTPALLGMIERAGRARGGVPHWGMNASADAGDVERGYRRLDTWRRVRWELTRGETLRTFDSDFTRRCGLSAPPVFVRSARLDFGAGRTDAALWRPGSGTWMTIGADGAEWIEQWGEAGDIPVPGDFDGDGVTDAAVWRPRTGTWLVVESSRPRTVAVTPPAAAAAPPGALAGIGAAFGAGVVGGAAGGLVTLSERLLSAMERSRAQQWGQVGDVPVVGNFGGDARSDFTVWRPSTGEWFVKASATGAERVEQWGQAGDVPLAGDYSGDGRSDFVIWRPGTGEWWVRNSATGEVRVQQWGLEGDVPVPGDYNGDGRFDFAVWRPASGEWFIKDNATGAERAQQWGDPRDIPVPRAYTGAARSDFAVWRPSTGVLYIKDSATGAERTLQYGRFGDVPM
jgi:hypothetical protein